MSTTISNAPSPQYAGSTSPSLPATEHGTDILSVCFCPRFKLLCAKWDRFTTSAELRQSVRLLARAAAVLKAELVLVEIPAQYNVSPEDRQWAMKFMRDALKYTSILRVARVVSADVNDLTRQALLTLNQMPYEANLFEDRESALRWLLGDNYKVIVKDEFIQIPLTFNLKLIRSGLKSRANATVQVASAQQGNPTRVPETLPELITIETEFISITLDKTKSLMNIRWKKAPQSRQYRYGMLKAARVLIDHRLERLLLNNQRLGVLTLEDQGWLITTSQQILPKMNLRKLAVITSADALQQMSSENIGKKLKQAALNHQAHYFLAEEDALEWLVAD
ncbi:hypothetical protein C8E01_103167 [Pontibacter virosus]|uniref:SpoIIAA-like protein n=1 Tax=Pontibacter virosus TaxID=1765052 RepID=A0A2U1B141_9BACT|nr:hypothetical protein C8E01_103167 [Pontibacter virosus]